MLCMKASHKGLCGLKWGVCCTAIVEGLGAGVWGPTGGNGAEFAAHSECSHRPLRISGTPAGAALDVKLRNDDAPLLTRSMLSQSALRKSPMRPCQQILTQCNGRDGKWVSKHTAQMYLIGTG